MLYALNTADRAKEMTLRNESPYMQSGKAYIELVMQLLWRKQRPHGHHPAHTSLKFKNAFVPFGRKNGLSNVLLTTK